MKPKIMRQVPERALWFFATDGMDVTDDNGFVLRLYSGRSVEHPYLGTIAIDLAGMSHRETIPILNAHNRAEIVGFGTPNIQDGNLKVTGQFLTDSPQAECIRSYASQGFPFEASAGYNAVTEVEQVNKGQIVSVNGHDVCGPAEIWRKCELREGSFCVFGVDSDTGLVTNAEDESIVSIAMPVNQEGQEMADETVRDMTPKEFEDTHPEVITALLEKGASEATLVSNERMTHFRKAFPSNLDFAIDQLLAGHDLTQAKAEFADVLKKENESLAHQLAEAKKNAGFTPSDGERETPEESPDDALTFEERAAKTAKTEWTESKDIRTEFASAGGEAAYLAFRTRELMTLEA